MRATDRKIFALAVPALGSLIAEPLFLVVDSSMIGHLGATPLAGLAIASSILQTAVGLMVFLAYATTPLVARRLGTHDRRGAVQAGIDGLWLALGIGAILGVVLLLALDPVIAAFHPAPPVAEAAHAYLAISCAGLPAMLLVFAATGLLRGLQDTRTPLFVAGLGFAANAALNALFIYGLGLGIAGSAVGTVIAQWGMVAAYLVIIGRHARAVGAGFLPHRAGLAQAGRSGWWLLIRTAGLRAAVLSTVAGAALHGTASTAAFQVVFTLLSTAAFALDALAIAAQAMIGEALGAGDAERIRGIVGRTEYWGVVLGAAIGIVIAACSSLIGRIFTSDADLLAILPWPVAIVGLTLPLSGYVYVLDGVLMGAGDSRYLGWTSLVNLAAYAPFLWLAIALPAAGSSALIALTAAYALAFMGARATTLGVRGRRFVRDPLGFG